MSGRRAADRRFEKVAIISDLHSVLMDRDAFSVFKQIYAENDFHRLVINGDLVDLPMLSSHTKKLDLIKPMAPEEVSLEDELDFTTDEILRPLNKAKKGKVPILIRLGNHDRRALRVLSSDASVLSKVLKQVARRGSPRLEDLLGLKEFNAEVSYKERDYLWHRFCLFHGQRTNVNRCRDNFYDFGQGTSGHTHKLAKYERQTDYGTAKWVESGCLRTITRIEYMDEGHLPNWQHGFVTVWFCKKSGEMYVKQHEIERGRCEFNGTVYSA